MLRVLLLALFVTGSVWAQTSTYVPPTITALGALTPKIGVAGDTLTAPIVVAGGSDGQFVVSLSYRGSSAPSFLAGVEGNAAVVKITTANVLGFYQLQSVTVVTSSGITEYGRDGLISRVGYSGAALPATHKLNLSALDFTIQGSGTTPPKSPVITTQPVDQRVNVGEPASFTVEWTSELPASVRWRKDGVLIPGATNQTLRIAKTTFADAGKYDLVVANNIGEFTTSNPATLFVLPGKLKNISVRIVVADNGLLTAGFVVDYPKTVLVRGIGRSLEQFGVPAGSTMPNPKIELYNSSSLIVASNDDYVPTAADNATAAAVGAFGITSAQDAAMTVTLPAGAYTVQLRPVGGKGGDALIEVYDVN